VDLAGVGVPALTRFADLHLHSTASDGLLPPAEVIRRAHAAGLAAVALTDHDTVAGLPEAQAEGARLGVQVVGGCEFSVKVSWGELHLLGYFLPVGEPAIEEFLAGARAMRLTRAGQIVEHLQAWGVDITMEDVHAEAGTASVGRPHVARVLVRRGTVPSVSAAFDEFLGHGRRAYVEKVLPSLSEVAILVHRFRGLVSAAHLRERATRATLSALKQDGLDAVEARHPGHSPDHAAQVEKLARALGLVPTGGSDWHGEDAENGHGALGSEAVPLAWLEDLDARR
jgi:hypothetical protein